MFKFFVYISRIHTSNDISYILGLGTSVYTYKKTHKLYKLHKIENKIPQIVSKYMLGSLRVYFRFNRQFQG